MIFRILFLISITIPFQGCAIHKPCSEAGDISWEPKIIGDKRCTQKTLPDGRVVNDGPFRQDYEKTHKVALEGNFVDGQKDGIWTYYAEDGKLKSVKFFSRNVEKTPSVEIQKKIDLIIEQKSGAKK